MSCRLTINTREFTLTDEHATAVSDDVLDLVRAGGGYVHVAPLVGPEADVLITAASTVTFERIRSIQPVTIGSGESWHSDNWPDDFS